jgi:alanine or glycine:cation symporter, AGCS family
MDRVVLAQRPSRWTLRALIGTGTLLAALALGQFSARASQEVDSPGVAAEAMTEPAGAMVRIQERIDEAFGDAVSAIAPILFVEVGFEYGIPLIVLVLTLGGVVFTCYYGFPNIRFFRHSFSVIRGRYSNPADHGEVSHFQALTSALSATVGLGNIAGVAVAITLGGPGAVFWMWVVAFLGMSTKFSESTLAQAYRAIGKQEHVLGGPMMYLDAGIRDVLGRTGTFAKVLGKVLAIVFALFTITGSIGGGNMFQGNQTFTIISSITGIPADYAWLGGLVMAVLVGIVIIGGIRRIGEVTSRMVPAMCLFYVAVCLVIILSNIGQVPAMFVHIFSEAFTPEAGIGGIIGVFIQGAKRAAFSNEAGLGSSAIAHSAARTSEPVREGTVAMLEPFIDTIIVCTMTALTILITHSHLDPATGEPFTSPQGVAITMAAFHSLSPWLVYLLAIAVFVFAYSTMITWSYYGERASEYLFGRRAIMPYRFVFLFFVVMGPIVSLGNLIDFTDLLILSMAYPNILGMLILAPKVRAMAHDYATRLRSGQMRRHK